MDQSQTASDYKNYFSNKFNLLFKEFVNYLLELLPDECEEKKSMIKIQGLFDKLNYDKIIKKIGENSKLIDILSVIVKNNFDDNTYYRYFNNTEKYWNILPSFNINTILLQIKDRNLHVEIYNKINELYVCAVTYGKVIEQISECDNGKEFNPFDSIGNVAENMDINTLFNGVEVKSISAYDMLMSTLINQQTTNKMDEYMNNIKESDVNEAASKLNDVLESDEFKGNKQTSKILSEMLSNIKSEVINLKNTQNEKSMGGKQGVEQLLGIAQTVAGRMMGQIKDSNVSVLDIWDATSHLAKNTVQSDALNVVDNLIRSNIAANMNANANANAEQNINSENNNTENIPLNSSINENNDKKKSVKKSKEKKSKK